MKFQNWIQNHINQITLLSAVLIVLGYAGKFAGSLLTYNIVLAVASIIAAVPIMIHAYQALRAKVISIESAIVTFLFLFGSYLEARTLSKTRESIKSLTEMAPTTATLVHDDGTTEEVDVDDVEEDDIV